MPDKTPKVYGYTMGIKRLSAFCYLIGFAVDVMFIAYAVEGKD
ncbi:hypothetical protein [Alteromonas gracilis]